MHLNTFDHYQQVDTRVHKLDPRVKVLVAILFILSTALLPDGAWLVYMCSWALVVAVGLAAHIRPWFLIKRSLLVLPFMFAAVTVAFTLPGAVLWNGPFGLSISDSGLIRFLSILCRGWISVQIAVLLTATTRFPDLLHALRHLKVPAIFVSILAFMYRYLFVLADEVARLLRARAARSAQLPGQPAGRSLRWRATVAGHMVGQLLVRSMARSDRVYQAMLARGYQGELLTINPHVMVSFDWLVFVVALLGLLLLQVLAHVV